MFDFEEFKRSVYGEGGYEDIKLREGWYNLEDKWPEPNTEVITYYLCHDIEEGSSYYWSEVMHERLLDYIDSEVIYWTYKPFD